MKRSGASGTHVRLMLGRPPMPVYRMMLLVHRPRKCEAYALFRLGSVKGGRFLLREAFTRKMSTAEGADCFFLTMELR